MSRIKRRILRELVHTNKVPCAYCGKIETDINHITVDHITPLSSRGVDTTNNYIVCCAKCNSRKDRMSFAKWIKKIDVCNIINYLVVINDFIPRRDYYYHLFSNNSIPHELKLLMEEAV
jgi:uncharacterized metal-binding protein